MTRISATLQSFFTDRLARQKRASSHTIAAYRDTLRLLLAYAKKKTGTSPERLDWAQLDAQLIGDFLDDLEQARGNTIRTRNARLTAIRSLYSYAALLHPEHAATIAQVLAIPAKRFEKATITYLNETETKALLVTPDRSTWEGRRDFALILTAIQTGLRLSELLGLNRADITLGTGANLRCEGKGRKHRAVPLDDTVQNVLTGWLIHDRQATPDQPVFTTRGGKRLSPDAVQRRIILYAARATAACPSLAGRRLHPHVFRHTAAMNLLHGGVDTTVIALWLGHADVRSTNAYLHADLAIKERALQKVAPQDAPQGRYRAPDKLLAFLEAL
ncbi:tyrosine-type recombinase/integrase [Humibacter antri]